MKRILAFDLGTSGVKASLYDETGMLLTSEYGRYETIYGVNGIREQRPEDWWNAIKVTTRSICLKFKVEQIEAIGISGHSLGVVAVDEKGQLLSDTTPIWSDARAKMQGDSFFERVDYKQWYDTTGNGFPRHLYSIFKIRWYKDFAPDLYEKTRCFLGTKDYINFKLTSKMVTDRSYASGSGVYGLKEESYVDAYIDAIGVDPMKIPPVVSSEKVIGYVTDDAASELGLKKGIAVVAGGVDNACMTLGANCRHDGDAYASLGTSAWITVCSDKPSVNFEAKTYTFAHCISELYLPSVGIFSSGSTLEWMISNLHLGCDTKESVYEKISNMVASVPPGANRLMFIPNLAGGSSFDSSPDVRGLLAGIDLRHTEADVARAVYEGIAMHLRSAYDVLAERTPIRDKLLLVGGGAKNFVWRSIYSSVFGLPVVKTKVDQGAAALGAAALAAVGTGIWSSYDVLDKVHGEGDIIIPRQEEIDYYAELLPKYKQICRLTADIAKLL